MNKVLFLLLFTTASLFAQNNTSKVHIAGAMKNVMWKGQLQGSIDLDTISDRKNLYGLGPVEGLAGELLIINGKAYKSTVISASEMKVEATYNAKAPFFVYGYADKFTESALPSTANDLAGLETYLEEKTKAVKEPFIFVLKGTVNSASVHVVNLPEGSKVSSPDDAPREQVSYTIENRPVEIVGFFSRTHQSVFTHHDTFMHLHLITTDGTIMGHLDRVEFEPGGMTLYLPFN